jgi:hypothetical protein
MDDFSMSNLLVEPKMNKFEDLDESFSQSLDLFMGKED